jgi:uncharacterized protein YjbI with pentapeptide repeats
VDFDDVDFTDATFQNCTFEKCTFRICNFSGVKFRTIDDEELHFESKLLGNCWEWKDNVPKLLAIEFSCDLYDPGLESAERVGFDTRREKRRIAGANHGFKPNAKLKVVK